LLGRQRSKRHLEVFDRRLLQTAALGDEVALDKWRWTNCSSARLAKGCHPLTHRLMPGDQRANQTIDFGAPARTPLIQRNRLAQSAAIESQAFHTPRLLSHTL
jgi:hypothetical protein